MFCDKLLISLGGCNAIRGIGFGEPVVIGKTKRLKVTPGPSASRQVPDEPWSGPVYVIPDVTAQHSTALKVVPAVT